MEELDMVSHINPIALSEAVGEQVCLFRGNTEYKAFVEKFKPKKTTDDCYTPPEVYKVIKNWACQEYGIDEGTIVRPFYPGGDYERFDYPDGCTVLDNPPFSILAKICDFYLKRNIKFFLFAPSLTVFSGRKIALEINHIICDCDIEYENGAVVRTSFVTSYGDGIVAQTSPELTRRVNSITAKLRERKVKPLPKYEYPPYVVTAAMLQKYSKYGIDFKVRRDECMHISRLDAQVEKGKTIFGAGLLLSGEKAKERAVAERAAAERAAAERAAAERAAEVVWALSSREMEIVRKLNTQD